MSETVRAKVLAGADAHEIESLAVSEGMRTMLRHGVERVCAGETTIEEILRVTSLS
jgi:general secretion pathway protein E